MKKNNKIIRKLLQILHLSKTKIIEFDDKSKCDISVVKELADFIGTPPVYHLDVSALKCFHQNSRTWIERKH